MAEIKEQVYRDPRPAEYFDQFHNRTRSGEPGWTYEMTRPLVTTLGLFMFRTRAIGTENVPATGPVLFAPNHFSQMDHFFVGMYIRRRIRFMAKSQLFGPPVLTYVFTHGGVFPVRRGHRDDEAFKTAETVLQNQDGAVLVYAEGGRSRTGGLGEPRPGIGRIALDNPGVPVVPVAIHGSAKVRKFRKLVFPKVTVQFGEPLTFDGIPDSTREQQLEVANRIFDRVRDMYDVLEAEGREGARRRLAEAQPAD